MRGMGLSHLWPASCWNEKTSHIQDEARCPHWELPSGDVQVVRKGGLSSTAHKKLTPAYNLLSGLGRDPPTVRASDETTALTLVQLQLPERL